MKVNLAKYDNSWYYPGRGIVIRTLWYIVNILVLVNPLNPVSSIKVFFLKLFGAKIGKGTVIKPGVNIKYPWNLKIGNFTWIGERVWIDNLTEVSIGSNCCISQGALLLCGNHDYRSETFDLMVGKINMEDGVWIGANSVVPGMTNCLSHSVLAVSSVAPRQMDAYWVYRGNPAEKVKVREVNSSG